MATRCVQKTRRDCHRSATSTSTCWDATRSPYLNRSLGASSGRSETPLTAVANRTFRSIAPQTPDPGQAGGQDADREAAQGRGRSVDAVTPAPAQVAAYLAERAETRKAVDRVCLGGGDRGLGARAPPGRVDPTKAPLRFPCSVFRICQKPRGRSTSRASRATSQTPSRSSAVRESARDSGRLVAPGLVFGLQGAELADGVGPTASAAAGGPWGARRCERARRGRGARGIRRPAPENGHACLQQRGTGFSPAVRGLACSSPANISCAVARDIRGLARVPFAGASALRQCECVRGRQAPRPTRLGRLSAARDRRG